MIEALLSSATLSGVLWLTVTLLSYMGGLFIHRTAGGHSLTHPLIFTATVVGILAFLSNTPIVVYQTSASVLHWLLGPATVALALPIYRQWQQLKHYGWRLAVSITIGGIITPIMAWTILWMCDAPHAMQLTMLAKSITTPLAMETSAQIGGIPALAAVFVILSGVAGAVLSSAIFALFNVTSREAQGIALGTVAHAIGTAKAIHMGEDVAAMATMGLCINGIATAIILPLIILA
jgi:putative effector of murein hydrolase